MSDSQALALRVHGLNVSYGSVHAVRDIDLEVASGEVLGVIGANGAGKSSLLNAIAGVVKASGGTIMLGGTDISRAAVTERVRAGLAVSPEGRGILADMTVEENLQLGAYSVRKRDRTLLAGRLADAFDIFPVLGDRRHQPAQTLSGGEAAMLSVARALMSGPKLLLLDEPTLGLAPIMRQRLFERIAALKETGLAMVIVEQRATELLDVSDRLLQMKQGESAGISRASDMDAESLAHLYFGVGVESA